MKSLIILMTLLMIKQRTIKYGIKVNIFVYYVPYSLSLRHHRQVVADRLNKGDRELDFINSILEDDPKNYHGWSYRQWVVKRFNLWEKELAYTSDLITFDIRNNSAWNYRYYILFERPTKPTEEEIRQEIEYVKMICISYW